MTTLLIFTLLTLYYLAIFYLVYRAQILFKFAMHKKYSCITPVLEKPDMNEVAIFSLMSSLCLGLPIPFFFMSSWSFVPSGIKLTLAEVLWKMKPGVNYNE